MPFGVYIDMMIEVVGILNSWYNGKVNWCFLRRYFMEKDIEIYTEKVKRYYDREGKLTQYPSKRPMRIIALVRIAEKFVADKKYTEKEVNEIIKDSISFTDVELIRREMFQYKLINRLRDGSEYWVEENWREVCEEYIREN